MPTPPLAATWLPERASSVAPAVDAIFWSLVIGSGLIVAALAGLNLVLLVRYRRGSAAPRHATPPRIETRIEATWIAGTCAAFLGLFFWDARVFLRLERPPAGASEIHVVARQWMWDVRHPDGPRELNTLHVPVGEDIRLRLSSEDVIHSFFVPAFRIKQDVVPGKETSVWFRAERPGTYHLFCAQYCGTAHAAMMGSVVALPPEQYATWVAREHPDGAIARRGRQLFQRYNCSGCHDPPAAVRAPPLAGVYGRLVPLQDGRVIRADAAYLRDSILQPGKDVVAGYDPVMPSFQGVIPEGELLELIAYLQALRDEPPAVPRPAAP